MKKIRKVIALLLCAVLLVCAAVAGTVAYLTDTKTVKNTFTVGKVNITLQEYKINGETGERTNELVDGNDNIRMIPGRNIQKEPVLTVLANSEECYVRMFVKITWPSTAVGLLSDQEYSTWFKTNGEDGFGSDWQAVGLIKNGTSQGDDDGEDIYEFRFRNSVSKATENQTLKPLFTTFAIPGNLTSEQIAAIEGSSITLIAQAIQAEGFRDADAAFQAAGYPDGVTVTTVTPNP